MSFFRRVDSDSKGRHLQATTLIPKGRCIHVERPLLKLQSLENRRYNSVCHCCMAFLPTQQQRKCSCGTLYCSPDCQEEDFLIHNVICTGPCTEEDPLVEFKQWAVHSNELFLLVAEWWVAQYITKNDAYIDFCMTPWEQVVEREANDMREQLQKLCQQAAQLLKPVLQRHQIPVMTATDVSLRMGCLEQNCMGIRVRSPQIRRVLSDPDYRRSQHEHICRALAQTGMIANDGELENDEEWDYSHDEIARFLATLDLHEDICVEDESFPRKSQNEGDDWDLLFPPLDGTAMWATACKMNHSCCPNVIVVYPARHVECVVAHMVALRDIQKGEELTISYIDTDLPTIERQAMLRVYGFECQCPKCVDSWKIKDDQDADDDLFGSDSEADDESTVNGNQHDNDEKTGEQLLEDCYHRLDTVSNHTFLGTTPVQLVARVATNVKSSCGIDTNASDLVTQLHQVCIEATKERDYCQCRQVGLKLEEMLWAVLQKESSLSGNEPIYWSACLTSALGLAHDGAFLSCLRLLDKALMLGMPRDDFFEYIEVHAQQMTQPRYNCPVRMLPIEWTEAESGLSAPIAFPVRESQSLVIDSSSNPQVVRRMARGFAALDRWRDLGLFQNEHGHRLVPIECGSMLNRNLQEKVTSLKDFVTKYLSKEPEFWTLDMAIKRSNDVAYLAQHALLDQIPALRPHVDMDFCEATRVNVWFGTGGTRTPLHFDSYDNWLVQIVGYKYVRLYDPSQTARLYVNKDMNSQGNMSDLDCEHEDWEMHGMARGAIYEEVLLMPGDALYIPSGVWHYVRSLSTSISVNYWF